MGITLSNFTSPKFTMNFGNLDISTHTTRACARAPVRVDPAGGGTDAPPFCTDHGGLVLNFTVSRYMHASVQRLAAGQGIWVYSADLDTGVHAPDVDALDQDGPLGFLCSYVRRLVPNNESILLITESDIPAGSGLGGSGALGVAVVAAFDAAFGVARTKLEVAGISNQVERGDLGYVGGCQDACVAAVGGINLIHIKTDGKVEAEPVQITEQTRLNLERRLVLIYTGASHVSSSIHQDILDAYKLTNSPVLKAMFDLKRGAQDTADALRAGDVDGFGHLLGDCNRYLYALHDSCDSEVLRKLHSAIGDTIIGAKTCGAGGGGYVLALTRQGERAQCIRRARELGGTAEPVRIDTHGVRSWPSLAMADDELDHLFEGIQV